MKPVVDRLADRYEGKANVEVVNLTAGDPDDERLADLFGIQYVPTFVFCDSDGTRRGEIVGETSLEELGRRMDALK